MSRLFLSFFVVLLLSTFTAAQVPGVEGTFARCVNGATETLSIAKDGATSYSYAFKRCSVAAVPANYTTLQTLTSNATEVRPDGSFRVKFTYITDTVTIYNTTAMAQYKARCPALNFTVNGTTNVISCFCPATYTNLKVLSKDEFAVDKSGSICNQTNLSGIYAPPTFIRVIDPDTNSSPISTGTESASPLSRSNSPSNSNNNSPNSSSSDAPRAAPVLLAVFVSVLVFLLFISP